MSKLGRSVLHLINGEFYAGAERVQDLLAKQLPTMGYEVGFACLKDGIFADKLESKDTALYHFPMRSRLDLSLTYKLAQLIKQKHYQLIHTHTPRAALIGQLVSRLTSIPMIHHVHSPSQRDTEEGWRNLRNSTVEKLSLQKASKLIPVSKSLQQYLLDKGYKENRIHTVCNGVPLQNKIRKPYIAGEELVIGTVALFRPRKGIEVLLQALARMQRAGHKVKLHAVGPFETPEYQDSILQLVSELGLEQQVTWTGFTSDVINEFQQMHLFVLPSLFGEGMPMVVLEAMAAGLPVISTHVEGIPEVVRDGQEGLLTEPGSIPDLVAALLRITNGEASPTALGNNGQQRQQKEFSDIAMAKGVAAVYQEVLNP
ncbi:MAG: glycosyltransferase family 4 protein [Gammaproteobacteria bacterium]|nr:glycosyltransferase family 4 protein [Gammaproteobacteria bacterium]MCP4090218.1 glycosyltransferase family 4 protein [Gammaproteobacteria bacterium]MCP4832969.1 glycosyltransferase family 4 protein [Gammaproteobacteria bacterium]MCP4928656.1 glycosyltransferase family 4 protein [Gammaproteobacteria bacterium]